MTEPLRWHPYDPADPPPDIALKPDASLIVLFATAGTEGGPWAPRAAIALARGLAGMGRRVFLADLGLSRPALHGVLGEPNGEGVSDAFLYGASLRRVARPHHGGFFFAPAGTPVVGGERIFASPRWGTLAQGFARAHAQFVVYVPQGEPGHEALLARADQVVVLASPGERSSTGSVVGDGARVAAVLWPPQGAASTPVRPRGTAASAGAPPASPAPSPAPAARPPSAREGRSAGAGRFVLLALLALLALAVVLVLLGVVRLPGFGSDRQAGVGAIPALAVPASPAPPLFSLTLGSYREAAVARLQAESLGDERPDLLFVVAPVEVDGQVFHRLLVGPASDSQAVALRAEVAKTLSAEDPAGWLVRSTPLAYHLGRFATLEEARAHARELVPLEVPAYVLEEGEGTTLSFHVWAGAFADPQEASWLGSALAVDQIAASLERRRGHPPR